jgi:Ca-activated chloride channel homolog
MRSTVLLLGPTIIYLGGCAASYQASPAIEAMAAPGSVSPPQAMVAQEASEAPALSRDRFQAVGVNPFVAVEHDPFSTFAADVDTASYDILRQWLEEDELPPASSVRLEEYVNYFDYDYPPPEEDAEAPFSISLALASHPLRSDMALLRVGIQAAEAPSDRRPRANLVFLVDVSGSMSARDKLRLVRVLLHRVVQRLHRDDTLSIVTYAGTTSVRLPPTRASRRSRINRAIRGLRTGGGTAGAAGIELAYAQAREAFIEGGVNQVILCTDGDFNIGPQRDAELVELIEDRRRTGVTLTALGFGRGNLNDSMMEAVTNAGNGIYSVIYNEERAEEFIDEHLLPSVVHVAKDMKIQVELNPEAVSAYRLLGYVNRAIADEDFRDDMVDAGEVGAGHRVTALYELVLNGAAAPTPQGAPNTQTGAPVQGQREIGPGELLRVKVRYKDVGAHEQDVAHEIVETLPLQEPRLEFSRADVDFQWAFAVATFAELLQQSPFVRPEAWDFVTQVTSTQTRRDPARRELARVVEAARLIRGR